MCTYRRVLHGVQNCTYCYVLQCVHTVIYYNRYNVHNVLQLLQSVHTVMYYNVYIINILQSAHPVMYYNVCML